MASTGPLWAPTSSELNEALGGSFVLPLGAPLHSLRRFFSRNDGSWLGGVIIFLILAGVLPLTFVVMSLFCMLAVATCLRAFALHEYARQLTELAMEEGGHGLPLALTVGQGEASEGVHGAAGGPPGSAAARRRLRAAAAAGRPLSLLNLQLSLDRGLDFSEQDYQLLVRLDEMEAGAAAQRDQAPAPLPEDQLALLPVHVHRTPTKKGGRKGASGGLFSPEGTPRKGSAASLELSPAAALPPAASSCQPLPISVPVLVEQAPAAAALQAAKPAPAAAAGGGIMAVRSQSAAALAAPAGQEIDPVTPLASESEGEAEEADEPLCSVCIEPFSDGAKILSLPCRHQFHEECVTQWLRFKGAGATCPNCKGTVFSPTKTASLAAAAAAAQSPALLH